MKTVNVFDIRVYFAYNTVRGDETMIESMNDLISILLIAVLFVGFGYLILREFIHHRRRKVMEEEIEYYKEW
jgi:hypothetical protein